MQTPQDNIIARAFALAREGSCRNVSEIQGELKQEGYVNIAAHFEGPSFRRQLTALIRSSTSP